MVRMDVTEKLLTPAEAQARLGISRRTLMRWEHREPPVIMPIRLPSGHRRFRESDVAALAANP